MFSSVFSSTFSDIEVLLSGQILRFFKLRCNPRSPKEIFYEKGSTPVYNLDYENSLGLFFHTIRSKLFESWYDIN